MKSNRTLVAVLALVIASPIALSAVTRALASPPKPFLAPPAGKGDKCVRDVAYMRFHHMDYLKEVRDEYVRSGIRREKGLSSCRECHPDRARFCDRCHNSVQLSVDCFGCHDYPVPATAVAKSE
jgi:[DsrC]-trisulfide reductase subunit J